MLRTDWSDSENVDATDLNDMGQAVNALSGLSIKTSAYTLGVTDRVIAANAAAASFTLTLPDATAITGKQYTVKKTDSTINTVAIATTSSQTIDGMPSALLVFVGHTVTVVSDGANWIVVQSNYRGAQLGSSELFIGIPTTNSTLTDSALGNNKLPTLAITTIGIGQAVKIRFQGQCANTTPNAINALYLLANGATSNLAGAICSSPDSGARSISFEANPVLALGTSYTFEVGMYCQASSQAVFFADGLTPTQLTVVGQ